jgi:hypothetical protein
MPAIYPSVRNSSPGGGLHQLLLLPLLHHQLLLLQLLTRPEVLLLSDEHLGLVKQGQAMPEAQ